MCNRRGLSLIYPNHSTQVSVATEAASCGEQQTCVHDKGSHKVPTLQACSQAGGNPEWGSKLQEALQTPCQPPACRLQKFTVHLASVATYRLCQQPQDGAWFDLTLWGSHSHAPQGCTPVSLPA